MAVSCNGLEVLIDLFCVDWPSVSPLCMLLSPYTLMLGFRAGEIFAAKLYCLVQAQDLVGIAHISGCW